jgi:hypothetical protein
MNLKARDLIQDIKIKFEQFTSIMKSRLIIKLN